MEFLSRQSFLLNNIGRTAGDAIIYAFMSSILQGTSKKGPSTSSYITNYQIVNQAERQSSQKIQKSLLFLVIIQSRCIFFI
jgi:hypothetical protein